MEDHPANVWFERSVGTGEVVEKRPDNSDNKALNRLR